MGCDTPVVIGAGPAGLTAAYELTRAGQAPVVFEKSPTVGGLARTGVHRGYRFDIGGHRFHTRVDAVQKLWEQMLGDDFGHVERMSRIFYRGRFFNYPLEPANTLRQLGAIESLRILASYAHVRLRPLSRQDTFEQWVTQRFGRRLFQTFFKTYTEKVWGIPCDQIQAEWAASRIKGLSLSRAVLAMLVNSRHGPKSLIKSFRYPRLGPGMMWERFAEVTAQQGGTIHLSTGVERLDVRGGRVVAVVGKTADGAEMQVPAGQVITSMPITELIQRLDPPPPAAVLEAASQLKYRDFILVALMLNRAELFPDNWIYVHQPEVKVGRIQNFGNWSAAMVPEPGKTSLGMEYFCSIGDDIWSMTDPALIDLAGREIDRMGLAQRVDIEDALVIRQPQAYPIYDRSYHGHLQLLRDYLGTIPNLHTIGRNGMHRYNNMDHSMLAGMYAVRNLQGETHDLWRLDVDHGEFGSDESK